MILTSDVNELWKLQIIAKDVHEEASVFPTSW